MLTRLPSALRRFHHSLFHSAPADRQLKTELLRQMDGLMGGDGGSGSGSSSGSGSRSRAPPLVLLLGATNAPWELDSALLRRFEQRVLVGLPTPAGRLRALALGLQGLPHCVSAEKLREAAAARTDGFSQADLAAVTREVLMGPVRRCLQSGHFKKATDEATGEATVQPCGRWEWRSRAGSMLDLSVEQAKQVAAPPATDEDVEAALRAVKPTVGHAELARHVAFAAQYGNVQQAGGGGGGGGGGGAYHEAEAELPESFTAQPAQKAECAVQ